MRDGYKEHFGGLMYTVFSASSYNSGYWYNKGAVAILKLVDSNLEWEFTQFDAKVTVYLCVHHFRDF